MTAVETYEQAKPQTWLLPADVWPDPVPDDRDARYRSVLVVLHPEVPTTGLLERAVAIAVRDRARLTLISVVPEPPITIWLAPLLAEDPRRAMQSACERQLLTAIRSVPVTVPVTTVVARGRRATGVLRELDRGAHDVVLISAACSARTVKSLARRSPVPVLVLGGQTKGGWSR